MATNICDTCDRPVADERYYTPEYNAKHGDGNGCECQECCAVCWGGCVFTPTAKAKRAASLKYRAAEADRIVKALDELAKRAEACGTDVALDTSDELIVAARRYVAGGE